MGRKINIKDNLECAINAIQNSINAKKIYLFGSYADNTYTEDSDLDLCIVASLCGVRKIDILRKIRKEMLRTIDMPVDLLVYDDAEFNERLTSATTMEHKIVHDGVLLYEQ